RPVPGELAVLPRHRFPVGLRRHRHLRPPARFRRGGSTEMTGVDECTDQTGPLRGPRAPPAPGPWPSLDPLRTLDPLHAPPPPHTLGGIRSGRSPPPFPAMPPLPAHPQRPAPALPGGISLHERIYEPDLPQTRHLIGCHAQNAAL